jgi:hypothetical protein
MAPPNFKLSDIADVPTGSRIRVTDDDSAFSAPPEILQFSILPDGFPNHLSQPTGILSNTVTFMVA